MKPPDDLKCNIYIIYNGILGVVVIILNISVAIIILDPFSAA